LVTGHSDDGGVLTFFKAKKADFSACFFNVRAFLVIVNVAVLPLMEMDVIGKTTFALEYESIGAAKAAAQAKGKHKKAIRAFIYLSMVVSLLNKQKEGKKVHHHYLT
jgi:hypothetical protein